MSKQIKFFDLENNVLMPLRSIDNDLFISSYDFDQTSGKFLVVEPYDEDGSQGGRVVIYPQSPQLKINEITILKTFNRYGSLYYPLDAKFDYVRRRIWIADTGNNRVLKVRIDPGTVSFEITGITYPHALAADLNIGGVLVKGYTGKTMQTGIVAHYKSNGEELSSFRYDLRDADSSSSSSSFEGLLSSSSSSGEGTVPQMPSVDSLKYDHVRSRGWWVAKTKVYMIDEINHQVKTYDLRDDDFYFVYSLDIELSSGNAFIVAGDNHDERFVVQMFRDNNVVIGTGYIE